MGIYDNVTNKIKISSVLGPCSTFMHSCIHIWKDEVGLYGEDLSSHIEWKNPFNDNGVEKR